MTKRFQLRHMITVLILALSLAVALPTTMSVDAAGAKLNKTKVTICTGKSYTLKMPGVSKKVSWTTSNKKIVAVTKKSGKKAEKCTIKANKKGTATVTAKVKVGKKTKTFKCQVKVAGHKYGKVSYKWNKGYSKCTASKKCRRCGKTLKQTVKASSKTTTKATCTEKGAKKYTAKFTKYSFGTKTKKVSVKVKSHSVDSNKKISYKWNSGYSKCTATYYCKNGGEKQKESVKVNEQTTPATKTSKGKTVYTATFKTKGLETQTKTRVIPKLVYLTLNGKEVNSVTVRSDRPVTVKVVNDTIASVSSNHEKIKYTNDTQSVTIKTTDKLGDAKGVVSITTTGGTVLKCDVVTEFMPGTEYVGQNSISHTYTRDEAPYRYCAYGDLKDTWTNYDYSYKVKCQKRAEYDAAEYFYTHQTLRDGSVGNLVKKAQETYYACSERRNYKSKARLEWEALSYEVQENTYDDNFYNYVREKYGEAGERYHSIFCQGGGFNETVTTNAQLKKIVDDWTAVSGEVPSWYYYTAMSDWAEWSGADLGHRYDGEYDPLPPNYKD